jgi:hypothetical protein
MDNEQIVKSVRDQFAAKREEMFRKGLEKLLSEIAEVKQGQDEFMNGVVIPVYSSQESTCSA